MAAGGGGWAAGGAGETGGVSGPADGGCDGCGSTAAAWRPAARGDRAAGCGGGPGTTTGARGAGRAGAMRLGSPAGIRRTAAAEAGEGPGDDHGRPARTRLQAA